MRVRLAVGDDFALLHLFAFEHVEMAPLRDQLLVLVGPFVGDDQAALALGFLAETDRARALRQNRRILRLTGLEQVGDTRQTTGDVASLGRLLRDTRYDVAHGHLGT